MTTTTKTERVDVYTRVTNQIVETLERGVRPWLQPWASRRMLLRVANIDSEALKMPRS